MQALARRLRKAGGFANKSCGIHIHQTSFLMIFSFLGKELPSGRQTGCKIECFKALLRECFLLFRLSVEFTGITREKAAETAANYLDGTTAATRDYYNTQKVTASDEGCRFLPVHPFHEVGIHLFTVTHPLRCKTHE